MALRPPPPPLLTLLLLPLVLPLWLLRPPPREGGRRRLGPVGALEATDIGRERPVKGPLKEKYVYLVF